MPYKVLLYPQTLFYPLRLLKADPWVAHYFILNLFETESRMQALFKDKISKIRFLSLAEDLDYSQLFHIFSELKNLGLYLRTPESLKIYKLHQDLFEETYSIFKKGNNSLKAVEKAFLLLALAEDIDYTLFEVSFSLNNFTQTWEKIFEEKILFKDSFFIEEAPIEKYLFEGTERENLWEVKKRMNSFKELLPKVAFGEEKPDTLLISEEGILEEWGEDLEISEEKREGENLVILELKNSLNEKLGLSDNSSFPDFRRIILVK
ncbi:MAG: hypothetical protein ACP5KO_03390 [Caldimicrobium sp.]|uniref:Uncharacterized protein n=1 Tax=Caldimicrobium thiodismutans TaxID=1653476 RepID=A0A2N7PK32_9BACT|nr:MAG: hypothetical protein C0197_02710 [Caldimicrobium thiodismutans]